MKFSHSFEGINHIAYPSDQSNEDGSREWFIEYDQSGTYNYGYAGSFTERDGEFFVGDRSFKTAFGALNHWYHTKLVN